MKLKLATRLVPALILIALVVLVIKLQGENATAALVGVLGLGTSFALQTILQNVTAGLYLMAEKPFSPGDRLALGIGAPPAGSFSRIRLRTTHLRADDGTQVLIPNAQIFGGVIAIAPPPAAAPLPDTIPAD